MTYQERAKKCLEAFDGKYVYHDSDLTEESFVDGYIFGCVDQRKSDIEKACEWLKSYRQETPDGLGYIAGIVNDKTIEEFRKAMEKEP